MIVVGMWARFVQHIDFGKTRRSSINFCMLPATLYGGFCTLTLLIIGNIAEMKICAVFR